MDIVSLGFLFVLVLGGGASAWLADALGWKIGKKRHTMWGMRPKHFARFVVTIAGALIPLVTIGFLAGSFQGIRVWITQGREAAEQLPAVVRERDRARDELTGIQQQTAELRAGNLRSTTALAAQNATLAAQTQRLDEQRKKIDEQSKRIKALGPRLLALTNTARLRQVKVDRLTLANRRVQESLSDATESLNKGREDLKALTGELRIIKAQTDVAKEETRVARNTYTEIQNRNLELENRAIELDRNVRELTGRIDTLAAEISTLSTARDQARRETEAAESERDQLRTEVDRLERARSGLEEALTLYDRDFQQIRKQPLNFRAGDEIVRILVPAGTSFAESGAFVEALLRQARLEAERRGARSNPNTSPPMRAADLIPGTLNGKPISPAEQVERLATSLAGSPVDNVLVARSAFNIFGTEAVALDLSSYASPPVFRAGEVVAEGRLDSRRGDAAVYTQVQEFLSTRVQERAREAKMVPVIEAGQESFGQIEPAQILEVIRVARSEERVYRLQAIAVGEIRAGDRLRIELRLR